MELSELVREIKRGSTAAQKCLFDLLSDRMLSICCRYLKNEQDGEEAFLDGFYKVFKNIPTVQFCDDVTFLAWVKKIMINVCLMELRKRNVFHIVSESIAEDIVLPEEVLDGLSAKEIFDLIIQLPVGYRTVFNLFVVEGYDHKEIAMLLGIAEGTSKSQLYKAKLLLQKHLLQNGTHHAFRKIN